MLTLTQIQQQFEKFGLVQTMSYTENQFQEKLDEMIGTREMDREILKQLLIQCAKINNNNLQTTYRIQDMAQTIRDAAILLNEKIQKTEKYIKQCQDRLKKHSQQLQNTQSNIDIKYVYLNIISVNGIPKRYQYAICHLQVALGSQTTSVRPIEFFNKQNPEFNKEVEFSVPPNIYLLTIQFYTKQNDESLPTLLGQSQLSIGTLEDQLKSLKLQLKDPLGKEIGFFIDLEAQLINNRQSYLQEQIGKSNQKILEYEEELKQSKYQLDMVTRPFKKREQFQEIENSEKPIEIMANPLEQEPQQQISKFIDNEDQQTQPLDEYPQAPEDLDLGMQIFSCYGLITLFVCSAKPSFMDVLVCHGLLFTVFLDRFEPAHVKLVGIGLFASIIYDILWLSQYHSWWNSTDQNNPEWGQHAAFFLKIILVLTYIQFFYKFLVFYYLYQFYKHSQDPTKSYVFKIWNILYKVGKNRENVCWQ